MVIEENELRKLSEIMSGPQLAKHFDVNIKTIYRRFKKYKIVAKPQKLWAASYEKYNYNYNVFLNEDSISYYLLGAYITDGCMKKGCVSLSSADKDWLETIRDLICNDIPLIKE